MECHHVRHFMDQKQCLIAEASVESRRSGELSRRHRQVIDASLMISVNLVSRMRIKLTSNQLRLEPEYFQHSPEVSLLVSECLQ
jgi:hypothetical protein